MEYKAVFHIDMDEKNSFHIGLLNITNLIKGISGEPYDLVLLFIRPAANLLMEASLVDTIGHIQTLLQIGVRFIVCNNALARLEITPGQIVQGVDIIPAEIVTLIDLQTMGLPTLSPDAAH